MVNRNMVTNLSKYFEPSAKTWREAIIAWNKYVIKFSEKSRSSVY